MGPVKVVGVGFVGKAERNAGSQRPVGSVVDLYVKENASENGQGCDCDWDDCGSCDSGDYELDVVEDGRKHDCNPGHLEMIAISIGIEKKW